MATSIGAWLPRRLQGRLARAAPQPTRRAPAKEFASQHQREWLISNRRGSFAMGTVDRVPRRKYHSLLTVREPGFGEALNTLAEVEEWIDIDDKHFALHSYDWGDAIEPPAAQHLVGFDPAPRWTYDLDGLCLERSLWLDDDEDTLWIKYVFSGVSRDIGLHLRPVIRHRPLHKLTRANALLNGAVDFSQQPRPQALIHPYRDLPPVAMTVFDLDARFEPDGHWFHGVHYGWEKNRGYPDREDLFTPGEFSASIKADCVFYLRVGVTEPPTNAVVQQPAEPLPTDSFVTKLERSCDAFVATSAPHPTIIAGFPWFGEWGRDTMISLPGLCLERGRIDEALDILEAYATRREAGLIPNIPRSGSVAANTNAIDASLLFVRAVSMTAKHTRRKRIQGLKTIATQVVDAVGSGADPRVQLRDNGLLFIEPGPWALTWMDALIDGQPVTPRHGMCVDLNALWIHALRRAIAWRKTDASFCKQWRPVLNAARKSFARIFWLEHEGYLADCHDGERPDVSLRPNQLWALALGDNGLTQEQQGNALNKVRTHLLTPVGLRTLARDDPHYCPTYRGAQTLRDRAYHQGTVWPWLLGIYADALHKIEGEQSARQQLAPIVARLAEHWEDEACIGSISEVFDGEPPHRAGGAPAQAWSVAEVLRVAKAAAR